MKEEKCGGEMRTEKKVTAKGSNDVISEPDWLLFSQPLSFDSLCPRSLVSLEHD